MLSTLLQCPQAKTPAAQLGAASVSCPSSCKSACNLPQAPWHRHHRLTYPVAVTRAPCLAAVSAVKKCKEDGLMSLKTRACTCSGCFFSLTDWHCLFCSGSLRDISLCLTRDEVVPGTSRGCAILRMAVKLTAGSPLSPPQWGFINSTIQFCYSEVQEPKSLTSQYSLKISAESGSNPIRQPASPAVAACQGDGFMCLRCS